MRWFAGTSGYGYKEWKGVFYPEKIAPAEMLAYYGRKLPAVEINNTFYRMPRTHVLEGWRDAVPQEFRFVIKAPRRLTHQSRLDDDGAFLADRVATLEDRLGCVLFQLPPYLRKNVGRLVTFLDSWPRELPAAFEFRHISWFDEEVMDVLRHRGAAICVSDDGKMDLPAVIATTDWLYLRLRREAYDAPALAQWLARGNETGARHGFAFFKHEDAGAGPKLAAAFLELANRDQATA